MKKAVKYICNTRPFYIYLKKHYCPYCKAKLKIKHKREIVNSNSDNAREYDFSIGDTFLTGDVEFRTKCFYCPECKLYLSFDDIKKAEKKL